MRKCVFVALFVMLSACERAGMAVPIDDYEQARKIFWRALYPGDGNTLYCQQAFVGHSHAGINIEHVFPMGWVTNSLDCGTRKQCRANSAQFNNIEADLHNLYPARSDVNYQRSAYSFSEVSGEARRFGADCDFEVDERARRAEPAPAVRGEVARAMFYMVDRYKTQGLRLFRKQAQLLQKWHYDDPPSQHELYRNDRIEELQGNRNPFVDKPASLKQLIEQGYFH